MEWAANRYPEFIRLSLAACMTLLLIDLVTSLDMPIARFVTTVYALTRAGFLFCGTIFVMGSAVSVLGMTPLLRSLFAIVFYMHWIFAILPLVGNIISPAEVTFFADHLIGPASVSLATLKVYVANRET